MLEFKKLCNEVEKLDPLSRGILLAEKSIAVVRGIKKLDPPVDLDPVLTLATFIIGSVVSDGSIDEKAYLYIYPSLVKAFGKDFDFDAVKRTFRTAENVDKEISDRTRELMSIISQCDEILAADVITLCLAAVSVDGKISLKEKRYVKRLLKARR